MMPKRFWNEIGIGVETLLFKVGSIGIYKIGFDNDVWTIAINKIRKVEPITLEIEPF